VERSRSLGLSCKDPIEQNTTLCAPARWAPGQLVNANRHPGAIAALASLFLIAELD
jgi:hypothetical protein